MKLKTKCGIAAIATISLVLSLVCGGCNNDNNKCCEGYTGKITNEQSLKLVKQCHFLEKDSIELWTKRYEAYKTMLGSDKDTVAAKLDNEAARFLRSGSLSFNSCIIKKLLCDKNSIGLRVIYGIGFDNRIHIILVGINADYSNLYVDKDDCCDGAINKNPSKSADGVMSGSSTGGAEYGQMP